MAKREVPRQGETIPVSNGTTTERTGAEGVLRDSADRYRALFDRSLDAVYIHDLEGNFLDANDVALRLLGYSRDEILGLSFADLLDDSRLPAALTTLQEIMKNGYQAKPATIKLTRKDGSLVVVESVSAIIKKGGQPVAILGIARDITEQRRAEEALQKARDELELRVDERTAELRKVNQSLRHEIEERKRAEALLTGQTHALEILATGASLEEVLQALVLMVEEHSHGMLCSVLLVSADGSVLRPGAAPSLPDSFNQAVAQGIPIGPNTGSCGTAAYRAEPVVSADIANDPIWSDYRELAVSHGLRACWSTPILSSTGRVLGTFAMYYHEPRNPGPEEWQLIGVATHIARVAIERKRAEEALRESEERFRSLYTRTPGMLHSIDASGRLLDVSDHWLEVLGYERSEVIGRRAVEFLTEQSRRYAETVAIPQFMKTGHAREVSYQFVKRNGELVDIQLSAIAQYDREGNYSRSLAILTDVTAHKRAEEELQRAREALEGKVERGMLRKNPYGLTFREFTVLHHVAAGKADKEIARELGISPLTAQKHVANILSKMNAASRTEASVRAVREGLLD